MTWEFRVAIHLRSKGTHSGYAQVVAVKVFTRDVFGIQPNPRLMYAVENAAMKSLGPPSQV